MASRTQTPTCSHRITVPPMQTLILFPRVHKILFDRRIKSCRGARIVSGQRRFYGLQSTEIPRNHFQGSVTSISERQCSKGKNIGTGTRHSGPFSGTRRSIRRRFFRVSYATSRRRLWTVLTVGNINGRVFDDSSNYGTPEALFDVV